VKVNPGVDTRLIDPGVWLFLGAIAQIHREWTGEQLTVTSLRRPPGGRVSLHSTKEHEPVRAADFRRHQLDDAHGADPFCRYLQMRFGEWIGVVLEPEWLSLAELAERGGVLNVEPHVHIQLKSTTWPGVL